MNVAHEVTFSPIPATTIGPVKSILTSSSVPILHSDQKFLMGIKICVQGVIQEHVQCKESLMVPLSKYILYIPWCSNCHEACYGISAWGVTPS